MALGVMPAITYAAPFYWTGDNNAFWNATSLPAGTNWSLSADFNNGTAGLPGSSDDVFFNLFGATNLNTVLGQSFSINSLTFTPDDTAAVTIGGGNTLTIGAGGITNNASNVAALNTISSGLSLGASQTWTNNTSNSLTVSGVVGGSGGNALILKGSGNFTFTNANTYSGSTTLATAGSNLTIAGSNGSALNTASITLNGDGVLNLDSTAANHTSQNRIADATGIASSGGTINLIGNGASATTETLGTVTLGTGLTNVNVSGGSGAVLTLGSVSLPSFSRTLAGGAVNFSIPGGSSVKAANVTLDATGMIGGWATVGNMNSTSGSNVLDFATTDGSNNIIAISNYVNNNLEADFVSTNNVKLSGSVALTGATSTVNSLYVTGNAVLSFGAAPNGTNQSANTLIITSGAIISNAATGSSGIANQATITELANIGGPGVPNNGNGSGGNPTGNVYQGKITSGNGRDLIIDTASNLRINSIITDNGATPIGLTKNGTGVLDLSDGNKQNQPTNGGITEIANTFSGPVTINGGIVLVNDDLNFGKVPVSSNAAAIVLNGGEIRTTRGFAFAANRGITVGTRGGTLSYVGGNLWTISQKITGPGGIAFASLPGGNGAVLGNSISINNTGTASDYQGATTFLTTPNPGFVAAVGSLIQLGSNNQVPDNSAVTVTSSINGNGSRGLLNLNGRSDTWGSLAGNGDIVNGSGTVSNLTVGQNNLSTVYSGDLGKTGIAWNVGTLSGTANAGISLTKAGSGTLTMGSTNDYTGATNINGGVLLVGNGTGTTSGASLANTAVTVGNGAAAAALGGNGTIAGAVTVSASGHLAPAMTPSTTNTLTINNNLTLTAGGTLDFNFGAFALGSFGAGDVVAIGGAGALNMPASGALTLNISGLSGFGNGGGANVACYDLLDMSASSASFPAPSAFTWTINGSTNFNYAILKPGDANYPGYASKSFVLEVSQGNPTFTWQGNDGTNPTFWDTTTSNWASAGVGNVYSNAANVIFDDSASTSTVSVQAPGVSPNSIVFSNSSLSYAFSGSAITVTGGAGITKGGVGNVAFNTNVTAQKLTINGGAVSVASGKTLDGGAIKVGTGTSLSVAGALGSGNGLTVNGTVTFSNAAQTIASLTNDTSVTSGIVNLNGPTTLTVGSGNFLGTIAGTGGGLIKNTSGTLALSGNNTFTGDVTIKEGILSVASIAAPGSAQPLGQSTNNIILGDASTAGTLRYTGNSATLTRGITLAAGGGGLDAGTVGQVFTVSSTITNGTNQLTLGGIGEGAITSTLAGTGNVIMQGPGLWTLTNPNSVPGVTTFDIRGGTLVAETNGATTSFGSSAILINGGTLGISASTNATFTNAITLSATADAGIAALQSIPGGGAAGQTITLPAALPIPSSRKLTLGSYNGDTLDVTGPISDDGTATLATAGTSTIRLSGNISGFTGAIAPGGGILKFNYATPKTISNPVTASASTTIQNVDKLTFTGVVDVGTSTLTFDVADVVGQPVDVEFTNAIKRTLNAGGRLIKTGLGVMQTSGPDENYDLAVTVNGGTLNLNKASSPTVHAIGGAGLIINNGGTVVLAGTGTGDDQIYDAAGAGGGNVTMNTGGVFELNGKNEQATLVWNLGTLRNSNTSSPSTLTTTGAGYTLNGNGNIEAVSGAAITFTNNNPGHGNNFTLATTGVGTVTLDGGGDNASTTLIAHFGTLILAKLSSTSPSVHAASSINGVDAGATVQLAGSGDEQIYNGFPGFNFGVFNMNGTLDFNGHSEAWDKLTGSGNVINSVASNVTMTLGTNNGDGNIVADFSGSIQGDISVLKIGTGTQTFSGNNTYIGTTTANAGRLALATSLLTSSAIDASGGIIELTSSANGNKVIKTQTVSASGGGMIDLQNNKAIISGQNVATVTALVVTGRNGGTWDGPNGIITSQSNALPAQNITTLAVAAANAVNVNKTSFGGVPVTTETLVMYTYNGDANFSGNVDADDYFIIDSNYNKSGTVFGFNNGDFNYDGLIDGDDFVQIDAGFAGQGAPIAPGASLGGVSAVPEPASIGGIALAACGLLARRRRR